MREQLLIPVKFVYRRGWQDHWLFKCRCGNEKITRFNSYKSGGTRSCGCLLSLVKEKHGAAYRGVISPEYRAWRAMKNRCNNAKGLRYADWGGRGIRVCRQWAESFTKFLEDMGPRPGKGYSLDRINNDGNYEPGNCRWATAAQQQKNRRKFK
jgi:hypothetical protein